MQAMCWIIQVFHVANARNCIEKLNTSRANIGTKFILTHIFPGLSIFCSEWRCWAQHVRWLFQPDKKPTTHLDANPYLLSDIYFSVVFFQTHFTTLLTTLKWEVIYGTLRICYSNLMQSLSYLVCYWCDLKN